MEVELCRYDKTFLEKSYDWLTDPYIQHTTDTPMFSKEEQSKWYDSLSDKNDYY
jgi:hypothetical protein